jgi:hypothetical protein
MKHLIYLDAHFVDYLWDHRDYIWEGAEDSLTAAARADRSNQVEEYEALSGFPEACWLNHWHLIIGRRVLKELRQIRDRSRRQVLLDYAGQILALPGLGLCEDEDCRPHYYRRWATARRVRRSNSLQLVLPNFEVALGSPTNSRHSQWSRRPALAHLPDKDQPLVEEAILLGCDVLLTTDGPLLKQGKRLESQLGIRVRRLTEFLDEDNSEEPTVMNGWADLLLYTGLIPGNRY